MLYNLIIYLYLLGVAVYSLFNEKVRKMWRGERAAFGVLREKVDPRPATPGSTPPRSASSSRGAR